jgi:hypothetical protein
MRPDRAWMPAASEIRMLGVLAQLAGPTAIIRPALTVPETLLVRADQVIE